MPEDTDVIKVAPGRDHYDHSQVLHQEIASSVGQVVGRPVDFAEVIPPSIQQPAVNPEKLQTDTSLKQSLLGETEGDEPSKSFLELLKRRLGQQNSNGVVREK